MYQNIAKCNMYMGHCDLCTKEMGGCPTGDERLQKKEKEKEEYNFDENRPVSSSIETMMGMSIFEYCGL